MYPRHANKGLDTQRFHFFEFGKKFVIFNNSLIGTEISYV